MTVEIPGNGVTYFTTLLPLPCGNTHNVASNSEKKNTESAPSLTIPTGAAVEARYWMGASERMQLCVWVREISVRAQKRRREEEKARAKCSWSVRACERVWLYEKEVRMGK